MCSCAASEPELHGHAAIATSSPSSAAGVLVIELELHGHAANQLAAVRLEPSHHVVDSPRRWAHALSDL